MYKKCQDKFSMYLLPNKLKELRLQSNLRQRQLAAVLEIDSGLYSKIERGERPAKRTQVVALASIFNANEKELLALWLADQIKEITEQEKEIAEEAIELVKIR